MIKKQLKAVTLKDNNQKLIMSMFMWKFLLNLIDGR